MDDAKERRKQTAAKLRGRYPELAEFVDELRQAFGPEVRLTYLEDRHTGETWGNKDDK